jgi:hypothetical protein
MSGRLPVVLVDADDTLLENDRIQNDLQEHLERAERYVMVDDKLRILAATGVSSCNLDRKQ